MGRRQSKNLETKQKIGAAMNVSLIAMPERTVPIHKADVTGKLPRIGEQMMYIMSDNRSATLGPQIL